MLKAITWVINVALLKVLSAENSLKAAFQVFARG